MNASLSFAASAMQGHLYGADCEFSGVSIDTRTLARGNLFVALRGPNFDGADYLDAAMASGAAAAVVVEKADLAMPQIQVDDTKAALGRLGAAWRDAHELSLVGITGSNGKTTLKEMTRSILSRVGPTLATAGNLNNEYGMPLMLSRIDATHRFAVIEMGANHAGEIGYLTSLAKPDVVALTNAGPAHLEGFGSIEGVARAKGEILTGEPRPAVAVLNADDQYFGYWRDLATDLRIISFGVDSAADVTASNIRLEANGSSFELRLPHNRRVGVSIALTGEHNVRNACAAAAIAEALGIGAEETAAGLGSVQPVAGRLALMPGRNGSTLIDDSYNANPTSVVAAAQFLASLDGTGVFVLGDMGELGADADALHREAGLAIREAGVDRLLATGPLSRVAVAAFGDNGEWFENLDSLIERGTSLLAPGVTLLVKGSRLAGMERVVHALADAPAASRGAG